MYVELYEAWKRELENAELSRLPPDFYVKIADYVRRLKEESRMLDKRTAKANLLKKEVKNVRSMVQDLIRMRHRKLIKRAEESGNISPDLLTPEESRLLEGFSSSFDSFHSFGKSILRGHILKASAEMKRKRQILRFFRDIPAIVGGDMKTYGPFKSEDVASLPIENAKILLKEGLAEKVETN